MSVCFMQPNHQTRPKETYNNVPLLKRPTLSFTKTHLKMPSRKQGAIFFILPWVALVHWIDDCIPIFAFQRRFICWFIYIYYFLCCWDNWLLIVLKSMRIIPSLNKNFKFKRHSTKWFEHIRHLPIWLVATWCTIIRPSKVISEYILLIQILETGSWK